MAIIQKAGAIVLSQKNPSHIALLYRSREKDWTFPKGHVEKTESIIDTTRREIAEETGMSVRLVSAQLSPMEYDNSKGDHVVVHMFIMQSEDDSAIKTEHDGDMVIWIPYVDVAKKLSYDNIKHYYEGIIDVIEKTIHSL